jgi:hypothetical protein
MRIRARAPARFSLVFIWRKKTPQEALNGFNNVCPLIARADELRFPVSRTDDGRLLDPLSIYYGVNISPYKEPLEQFDPLLLVRFYNQMLAVLTQANGKPDRVKLTVFVAGKYRLLNMGPERDPYVLCTQWVAQEEQKEQLYKKAATGLGMEYDVRILKTDDLWSDERYWMILANLLGQREQMPNLRAFRRGSVKFGDLPKNLLGAVGEKERQKMANENACEIYLYAELAEARFLRETIGVSVKIGPQSEEEYDQYLRPEFSIVQLKMPLGLDSRPEEEKLLVPYIGLKEQERIWDKDVRTGNGDGRQVMEKIMRTADYPGGPLDQYSVRQALLEAGSEEEFSLKMQESESGRTESGKAGLARAVSDYAAQVFGVR